MRTHKLNTDPLSSTQGQHLFRSQNLLVRDAKCGSSTEKESVQQFRPFNTKNRQFNTPVSSTQKTVCSTQKSVISTPKKTKKSLSLKTFNATSEETVHAYDLFCESE